MNYIQAALWFLRCVSISLYMRHILTTCNTCSSLDGLLPATRQKKRCGSTLSESDWWWTQAINERNVVPGRWSKPPWYMWSIYTYLIIYILFSFYMYMYKYTYTYIYDICMIIYRKWSSSKHHGLLINKLLIKFVSAWKIHEDACKDTISCWNMLFHFYQQRATDTRKHLVGCLVLTCRVHLVTSHIVSL